MVKEVVITDLDGTLLNRQYRFDAAKKSLALLKRRSIPLVLCSSKTRAEIEVYRKKLGNRHPFISENGGAIFIPRGYFGKSNRRVLGNYEIIKIGTPYKKLTEFLKKLKKNFYVRAFSDMSAEEVARNSGLKVEQAKLAKKREYDEVFSFNNKREEKKLCDFVRKNGLRCIKGGQYYHLLGNNDKGKAVQILNELYKEKYGRVYSVSFGDAENDARMLRATDEGYVVHGPADWNRKVLKLFDFEKEHQKAESLYKSSIKILKELQQGNGAILASPPKSRYPYVYPRDHSICMIAFIDANLPERAKKALRFILSAQNRDGSFPQRVDRDGKDRSYKPIQLDSTGLVLHAFAKYIQATDDRKFLFKYRKKIRKAIDYVCSKLDRKRYLFFTPNSVHEFPPLEEGLEVWANAVCYSALKELEKIKIRNKLNLKKLKETIDKSFWNETHFVKNIRLDESSSVVIDVDASAYALADFGIFDDDNEKIEKTVEEIERELWHRKLGGICRYKKHVGRNNGGWGPWPHFTLMLCRHFIRNRRKRKADKYLKWIIDMAYRNKLPEHISTRKDFEEWVRNYKSAGILRKDREIMIKNARKNKMFQKGLAYSVLPLAWPHAEFVRTWGLYKQTFL